MAAAGGGPAGAAAAAAEVGSSASATHFAAGGGLSYEALQRAGAATAASAAAAAEDVSSDEDAADLIQHLRQSLYTTDTTPSLRPRSAASTSSARTGSGAPGGAGRGTAAEGASGAALKGAVRVRGARVPVWEAFGRDKRLSQRMDAALVRHGKADRVPPARVRRLPNSMLGGAAARDRHKYVDLHGDAGVRVERSFGMLRRDAEMLRARDEDPNERKSARLRQLDAATVARKAQEERDRVAAAERARASGGHVSILDSIADGLRADMRAIRFEGRKSEEEKAADRVAARDDDARARAEALLGGDTSDSDASSDGDESGSGSAAEGAGVAAAAHAPKDDGDPAPPPGD